MFQRILVPLDGSKLAEGAIPVAARIARASEGTIIFVGVVLPAVEFGTYSVERTILLKPEAFERREEAMTSYLAHLSDTYASELVGINTETDLVVGAAAPEIDAAAYAEQADLIVLCSHGETGLKRWFFGSVAQQMVRHSPVPVLVLGEQATSAAMMQQGKESTPHPLRILVPLDGSDRAETALQPVVQLLIALDVPQSSELHFLRVVDLPSAYGRMKSQAHLTDTLLVEARHEAEKYTNAVTERSRWVFEQLGFHLQITSSVITNTNVAATIVKEAEHVGDATHAGGGYDLIALATHGRGGLRRLVMGSVAEQVLGSTKLPLLMVRVPHPSHSHNTAEERSDADQIEVVKVEMQSWVGLL